MDRIVSVYQQLADHHERQGNAHLCDYFLVLAADAALLAGLPDEAERIRQRLLRLNPHHLLRPFGSLTEALDSADVQDYLDFLRQKYPPPAAEELLRSLEEVPPTAGSETDLPPTMALLEVDEVLPEPPPNLYETLKVYRVQEPPVEPTARPSAAPPPPPVKKKPTLQPVPKPRPQYVDGPAAPPPPRPARPRPMVPRRPEPEPGILRPPPREDDGPREAGAGAWVSVGLFVVVLTAGVVLAAYTLAGPFLRVP